MAPSSIAVSSVFNVISFLSVSTDDILNFILLNIPQTEQKQIVKYLDYKTKLIDDLIEKTKQKINSKSQKQQGITT